MSWKFKQILETFNRSSNFKLLKDSEHGIERECLRIDKNSELSQKLHPKELGSALKHPYITTDFAESQLELVTPVFKKEEDTLSFLKDVHLYIYKNLKDEYIWPMSMPCILPKEKDIPLAQFGKSREGLKRTKYRLGLGYRYGRKMQTVSGTHYNFSFSQKFWDKIHKMYGGKADRQKFISESYLKLARNFLRYSWVNTYLFGATPAVDKSYIDRKNKALKKLDRRTLYGENATSLRLSDVGYYSVVQNQLAISFNNLDEYIYDLKCAISMPSPRYKGFEGLNENILQIENEHYSRIRPKPGLQESETPLMALERGGIKYVEVRAVDINPYEAIGLRKDQMCFLYTFLVYCLFKESPGISRKEEKIITDNQNKVALYGRKAGLKLNNRGKSVDLKQWAGKILDDMKIVAELMDRNFKKNRYGMCLDSEIRKLEDPSLTPSAKILAEMSAKKEGHTMFGTRLAKMHKKTFNNETLKQDIEEKFQKISAKSLKDQENVEIIEETLLDGHEDMEASTQILIKEALKKGIRVEILDRKENFILLSKGRKHHYVKQASKTEKDSFMSYLIMDNKVITKQILGENGIKVPFGEMYEDVKSAIADYARFSKIKCVVKPVSTNYGIGISFVEPCNKDQYVKAVKEAFVYDNSVMVEEYVKGEEYRFLLVDYKTISVLNRIPSNVTGDGIHNISQLIDIKNDDAKNYKFFNHYSIKKGNVEMDHLKSLGLNFKSIPKDGKQIFLRTNSNVATGGDPIDCTDTTPDYLKRIAEKAARLVKARICGADIIISNGKYSVIELNYNPALQMHEYPVKGRKCAAAKAILKLLGF
ncbi:MAG: glutamate--cysteine ligase [bacterium]|nr:glutamate--cysteine ligase [bacterium]